jgi:glycerol uptake operon antiterminator
MFREQKILPAIRNMKQFEKALVSDCEFIVMLEFHMSLLDSIIKSAETHNKKILLHADLIKGLRNDEFSAEYLCQKIKPFGLISTRGNVLKTAKKNGLVAIQRLFLLDTIALETSYKLARSIEPDVIEVLPGVAPNLIEKVHKETGINVIAGGLISTKKEVDNLLNAGAKAITTSNEDLWKIRY